MKITYSRLLFSVLTLSAGLLSMARADELHEPGKGSEERKSIMDALRAANFADQKDNVVFLVHYLKAHNGWVWGDVSPQDRAGKPVAEGSTFLMHLEGGIWHEIDLGKVPEDPANPLGAQESSPGFIKNLLEMYPSVPRDIFPAHRK